MSEKRWPLDFELKNGTDYAPRVSTIFRQTEVKMKANGQRGLFAAEPLSQGTIIARDGGVVVEKSTPFPKYGYAVLLTENLMLAPRNYENLEPLSFVNHSCDSSMARLGGLIYVAKKDIPAGDELTIDYGPVISEYKPDWTLDCSCGSMKCRKKITAQDWRIPDLAKELWSEWLPFIQQKILGEK